ncbi:unnamed protein product, partial [marine sediment metagenome]
AKNLARVEMGALAARKPNQLSGGQQQRVALARALAARADCLLLDEPLSNLDARLRLHMRQELRSLVKSTGTTAVYVTHDQKEAMSMADRIAVMNAGQVVQVGTAEEIYDRPRSRFVADFLGEANFVEGRVAGASGPTVEVATPVGKLFALAAAATACGPQVTCCIRPERIWLAPAPGGDGPEGAAELAGSVVGCVYLGDLRQYTCELAGGARWKVSVLSHCGRPIAPGQDVLLRVGPEDVALLPASS